MKERNSNIELLRIASMLLIIAYHATRTIRLEYSSSFYTHSITTLLGSWGIIGVDVLVIISAWFLCEQNFRIEKIFAIIFQTFTYFFAYTVLSLILTQLAHHNFSQTITELCYGQMVAFMQPLWSQSYWFVSAYIFLLFLSPFLNQLIRSISRLSFQKLLAVFCFIPIYAQFSGTSTICDTFYFAYLYLLISYIKLYNPRIFNKFVHPLMFVTLFLCSIGAKLYLFYEHNSTIGKVFSFFLPRTFAETGRHSFLMLLLALLIFFSVIKKKPSHNPTINRLASCTLGIYLFHESNIWGLPNVLDTIIQSISPLFLTQPRLYPVKYLLIVLFVYFIGTIIEFIRYQTLQRPFMNWFTNHYSKRIQQINQWFTI